MKHARNETSLPSRLIGLYLGFCLRSGRWRIECDAPSWALLTGSTDATAIVVFWHEYLPLVAPLWWRARQDNPRLSLVALISRHRDGRMIAGIMRRWGIGIVDGSSGRPGRPDKGGAGALRCLLRLLRERQIVALTPDGPRGPRRAMQPGTAHLAALSGASVVPIAAQCTHSLRIGSWDRMVLPLPFARGVIRCGAPIVIDRDAHARGSAIIAAALDALDGGGR